MDRESESQSGPLIGVLTVTWNRKDDVLECIESVCRSSYPHFVIYVVDNASTDGTSEVIAERYPYVHLIRSEENLGFAGGNNLGLVKMLEDGVDAVFLINDDAIVDEDSLERLLAGGYDDPDIGVLAPKVMVHSDPGIIWSAGGKVDPATGVTVQRYYGEADHGQADEPSDIDYAVGCAMLVKSGVMHEVGFMDPRYFMYYEEVDWCRRIRQAGYRILYIPGSRVSHKVTLDGTGRNRAAYYFSRNRLLYLSSDEGKQSRAKWTALADILRSAAAHAVKGRTNESRQMMRGIADYLSKNFGKLEEGT